jgi:hypothetical protein
MSRFAMNNPEDWEERMEAAIDAGDERRKELQRDHEHDQLLEEIAQEADHAKGPVID